MYVTSPGKLNQPISHICSSLLLLKHGGIAGNQRCNLRRLGLQGPPRRPVPDRWLDQRCHDSGGGAEREADDARDSGESGDLLDRHHAPRQCRLRQHRHQLHGHLLHALPPWRIRRRHLPRPLPHHRHLRRCPSFRSDDPHHLHRRAGAASARLRRPGVRRLRQGLRRAAGGALPGAVPDGARHRRPQVERLRPRVGPVRRVRRRGEGADDEVLQLVLLLHQPRLAARGHGAGVHPGQPGPAVGVRAVRHRHRPRAGRVPLRHQAVQVQEAGGEPADADRGGVGGGVEEERRGPAAGSFASVRRGREATAGGERIEEAQPKAEAAAHQPVPILGQGGHRREPEREAHEMAALDPDGCGGSEERTPDAAHLGDDDHVLDRLRPDDHLLGVAGNHHGPPHRPLLPDPPGLAHRLLRRLHPPHRPHLRSDRRPRLPPLHPQPSRPHPAPAHRRRSRVLHPRHGRRRPRRDQALARGARKPGHPREGRRRPAQRLLAHPAVLLRRRWRGLHLHRAARLLPEGVSQGDEDHEHGAVPEHALAGLLRQLGSGGGGAQGHGQGRTWGMARRQPQPRQALQLLLAAGRHLHRQHVGLPCGGPVVRVQGAVRGGGRR